MEGEEREEDGERNRKWNLTGSRIRLGLGLSKIEIVAEFCQPRLL